MCMLNVEKKIIVIVADNSGFIVAFAYAKVSHI